MWAAFILFEIVFVIGAILLCQGRRPIQNALLYNAHNVNYPQQPQDRLYANRPQYFNQNGYNYQNGIRPGGESFARDPLAS